MPLSRRTFLAAGALALCPSAARAAAPAAGDALWIWGTGRGAWPEVAAAMRREGFATAFLSIPPAERALLDASPGALEAALAPFTEQGIAVMLAAGDPSWADGRPMPPALRNLLRMAAQSPGVAGVALDIEPYTLPLWRSGDDGRRRIAAALMDRLDEARALLAGSGRTLGTILHPTFATTPLPPGHGAGTMADGAIARTDAVVVMAYRNTPAAIERFGGRLLGALDAAPKPWWFGITVQGGQEEPFVSYANAAMPRIRADMRALGDLARARPCGRRYQGVAVHAYASLAPKLAP
ncbi:MAG TPA: hypothetical protein VD995_24890 [Azospirillum sp.]|nr:hypothetical protein [Azospirillum sp.]